jgi:sugar phosphate isomerase/epimerase
MAVFSLAALTVLDLAPPEMIELAARCGYEKVGLRLLPATQGGIAYRLMDDAPQMRETLQRLQSTGVTVADLEVVAFRPATDVASFTPFFEAGARLGAKHILVAAYDPDLARFSDRYRQFCEAAAQHGLTSDLEFMPWTSVPDLKTAMRIVADIDHPAAGVLVDALHFDRSQSALADIKAIPAKQLHYWQLCDGPAERPATTEQLIHAAREERMFPGEGGIDLVGLTQAMPDSLTISIEVPTVQLAKTVDTETRARRALAAGRAVVERARAAS